jgi:hypothetical protein
VENNPLKFIDPTGHMKDSFGAALVMPKNIQDSTGLISSAQSNWSYAQENIDKIKAGKSTGLTCSGCNKVETWKKYQDSMHAWAEKIRDTHEIGLTAYIKAEAGASLFAGGKIGISVQNNYSEDIRHTYLWSRRCFCWSYRRNDSYWRFNR